MESHGSRSCIDSSETIEQLRIRQLVVHQRLYLTVFRKTQLPQVFNTQDDKLLRQKDRSAKNNMKEHAEARRNIRRSDIKVGDKALLKNVTQTGKLVPKVPTATF